MLPIVLLIIASPLTAWAGIRYYAAVFASTTESK